jgi:hypothetical protein
VGGGIDATAAVSLTDTVIESNSGGGIYTTADLNVTNSLIENNTIAGSMPIEGLGAGTPGEGGGLYIVSGSTTITGTTFSGNQALGGPGANLVPRGFGPGGPGLGGAIYLAGGSLNMVNDTLAGNQAIGGPGGPEEPDGNGEGGGIYAAGGTLTAVNVTISGNSAIGGPPGEPPAGPTGMGEGGGVFNASATVTFTNTSLAGDTANTGGPDGQGTIGGDYNLIENPSGLTLPDATSHTITGQNHWPGTLQNNGGPTPTEALYSGSPAIAAGTSDGAPSVDQRGVPRGSPPDMGAYEANPAISAIPNQTGVEDVPITVNFTVSNSTEPITSMTAVSSNQTLVPNANLQLSNSGSSYTLKITPAAGEIGTTNITITVSNSVSSAIETFQVTIPITSGNIAAVGNGGSAVVFVIGTDHSLWRYASGTGWQQIGGAGTIESISAVLQPAATSSSSTGDPTVFAVTTPGGLAEYDNASGWTQIGGNGTIASVSAGTDRHGLADAWVLTTSDQLTEWSTSASWLPTPVGGAGSIAKYSAFTLDRVDVVTTAQAVYRYDPTIGWFSLGSPVAAENLSTAPNGTVFMTSVNGGLYEYTTSWTQLGGNGTITPQSPYAGLDKSGNAEVFVVTTAGDFAEYSLSGGWQTLSSTTVLTASATTIGEVAALFADGSISVHDDVTGWFAIAGPGFGLTE